jgi:mannose/cellobiose epimerase-like protein (N-acyl-D-glucosamine 2-epimerase family)
MSELVDRAQLGAADKYELGTQANRVFMADQSYDLLRFGRGVATPMGGAGWLDDFGRIDPSQGVQTWITCRMTHVYSLGAMLGFPGAEKIVDNMLAGLRGHLHDDVHGGWYPSVTLKTDADGKPYLDHETTKICYTHAFVMLASTSAYLLGRPGAKDLLDQAIDTYDKYFWDDKVGMAVDTWNTEMTKKDTYRGINANMHSTEAFLAIADATGDESFRDRAGRVISHLIEWAKNNNWRIPEHYNENWEPQLELNADKKDDQFKPYGATPGHGIEWSRLITQWAISTYGWDPATHTVSKEAQPYVDAAEHLFARAVADGWCADGEPGLVYTTDWSGKPVVHDRMHWTIAEGIDASATLYKVTGRDFYRSWYATFVRFVDEHLADHVNGSWWHQMDAHNHVLRTVWPGKSDLYHAFQSTLIPYNDPAVSIAAAVARTQA